ncbi:MAG: LamG domain-containing protein, partial [Verrucomicrobia bacterium]|nr:LamG domain-containing protein [Verrucomicrobiota bacterium]
MKLSRVILLVIAGLLSATALKGLPDKPDLPVKLQEPWQKLYKKQDQKGKYVIGLWAFDNVAGEEVKLVEDVSGNGHAGKLVGGVINSDGKFGSCLESFPGWPVTDERHAVMVKNHADLSPEGAFSVEMWISPGKKMEGYSGAVLLDKKYVSDTDYKLSFGGGKTGEIRTLKVELGFGKKSATWNSDRVKFETGKWYHIAFTYDGEGTVQFLVNGQLSGGGTIGGLGSIAPGIKDLSIGDRYGSNYHGFPGRIDQVRLSKGILEFRPVRIQRVSDRSVFNRMEKEVELRYRITNLQRSSLKKSTFSMQLGAQKTKVMQVPELQSGKSQELAFPLDTRLRPDSYQVATIFSNKGKPAFQLKESFPVTLVARKLPNEFPVLMWGGGLQELDRMKKIGFTHALGPRANYGKIWQAGKAVDPDTKERQQETRGQLDRALAMGITFASQSAPATYLRNNKKYQRVDREGKVFKGREDICGLFPEIQKFCYNTGVSMARAYGDLPAFGGALLHTEVRGHSRPCFHQRDIEAFKAATGLAIPKEVITQRGVNYKKLANFPKNRVIPDNDSIYSYYRWFWKKGDGWNKLNSELNRGLKTSKRSDFWTWYDPAVRVATTYGSGGDVDVISQWTYSYPDPIRIGLATDELLTMASGAAHKQDVMKMTQIIWYRSQTAPIAKPGKKGPEWQAAWEREQPAAPFITVPPMQLREAFWTKIARPIKGIMYHGWASLVPTKSDGAYRYTHPETQFELTRLINEVIKPLGPTLKTVPGVKGDIAFYESFASQMYAGRGTYGWNGGWVGDA